MLFRFIFLGLAAVSIHQAAIDPVRLASEETSDNNILHEFRKAGDVPEIIRPVSVYFVASKTSLDSVKEGVVSLGFRFIGADEPDEADLIYVTLERSQAITPDEIARLRSDTLKIEAFYRVEYDGWEAPVEERRN